MSLDESGQWTVKFYCLRFFVIGESTAGWAGMMAPTSFRHDAAHRGHGRPSEKAAKLAQQLGQLQPFIAVSPPERTGQLPSFG
jgi:hypothetical protein